MASEEDTLKELKQMNKSLEEIKQLLLRVLAETPKKEPEPGPAPTEAATDTSRARSSTMGSEDKHAISAEESSKRARLSAMAWVDKYPMSECLKIIDGMPIDWSSGSFYRVTVTLEERHKREMFMNMSDNLRLQWINNAKYHGKMHEDY